MKHLLLITVVFTLVRPAALRAGEAGQNALTTPRIESFPRDGRGYRLIDWRGRADDFLAFALDPTRKGDYLPLMWWDDSKARENQATFGLPSYVGMTHQWGVFGGAHEGIVTMGTLLSGTLLGHDMTRYAVPGTRQPVNLVRMQEPYFSSEDGVFLDHLDAHTGGSFWYEITPSLLAGALVAAYPEEKSLAEKWHASCRRWAEATLALWDLNDYNFQAYDLRARLAVVKQWREPDAAAALAFLMQMAQAKWPSEPTFFHATRRSLDWLCEQNRNVNYEFFPTFGVYGAAGLVGVSRGALSTPKLRGGYVFAMETFIYAWPLLAATRYDNRLARPVGKWMHAAAHSARLFYPDQLPPSKQTDWAWASQHTTLIPYEGLMEKNNRTGEPGPFGSGDASNQGWGPMNLGIYSGAFSGIFGATVKPTNVPGVLAIDVCKTDFFAARSFPTLLLYNPRTEPAKVKLPLGDNPVRVWDAVSNSWLSQSIVKEVHLAVPPDAAVLATLVPASLKLRWDGGRLYAGDVIVDYSAR